MNLEYERKQLMSKEISNNDRFKEYLEKIHKIEEKRTIFSLISVEFLLS
jgi:hypothetical protein